MVFSISCGPNASSLPRDTAIQSDAWGDTPPGRVSLIWKFLRQSQIVALLMMSTEQTSFGPRTSSELIPNQWPDSEKKAVRVAKSAA